MNCIFTCVSCSCPHSLHCLCVCLCVLIYGNNTEIQLSGMWSGSVEEDINQMCNTASALDVPPVTCLETIQIQSFETEKQKLAPRAGREYNRPEQFRKQEIISSYWKIIKKKKGRKHFPPPPKCCKIKRKLSVFPPSLDHNYEDNSLQEPPVCFTESFLNYLLLKHDLSLGS